MAKNEDTYSASTFAAAQGEHRWLQQFVGAWVIEVEALLEPGQPPEHFKGREFVRNLGGLWVVGDGSGEMPGGGSAATLLVLGYDPQLRHFVGTWIGSMMTHLWVYSGALDANREVLTLDTEGPDMSGGGALTKFQDIFSFAGADHRILTSRMLRPDGQWLNFMTSHYRRD